MTKHFSKDTDHDSAFVKPVVGDKVPDDEVDDALVASAAEQRSTSEVIERVAEALKGSWHPLGGDEYGEDPDSSSDDNASIVRHENPQEFPTGKARRGADAKQRSKAARQ